MVWLPLLVRCRAWICQTCFNTWTSKHTDTFKVWVNPGLTNVPAAFRAGATSWYSRRFVLFLSNTRKMSWGQINTVHEQLDTLQHHEVQFKPVKLLISTFSIWEQMNTVINQCSIQTSIVTALYCWNLAIAVEFFHWLMWRQSTYRPPLDHVPQTLELMPAQPSGALSLDSILRSRKWTRHEPDPVFKSRLQGTGNWVLTEKISILNWYNYRGGGGGGVFIQESRDSMNNMSL